MRQGLKIDILFIKYTLGGNVFKEASIQLKTFLFFVCKKNNSSSEWDKTD